MSGLGRIVHGCAHKTEWCIFDRTIGLAIYIVFSSEHPIMKQENLSEAQENASEACLYSYSVFYVDGFILVLSRNSFQIVSVRMAIR